MAFRPHLANAALRGGMPPRRRRRGPSSLILIMLAAGLAYGYQQFANKPQQASFPPAATGLSGRAQWVVDGDTFKLNGQSVRLWGIDAPERDTPHGPAATSALTRLLRGNEVKCVAVGRSHDRIVGQCSAKGIDLSGMMVKAGWAKDLTDKSRGHYIPLEAEAKKLKRGMWKS